MANQVIEAVKADDRAALATMLAANPALSASVDDNGVSALLVSVYYRHREITELLAANVPTMSIHEAAAIGDLPTIRALGRWPDTLSSYSPDGWAPLHLAAAFGGFAPTKLLLELGANPNQRSRNPLENTPLHACAAILPSPEVASLLLDRGADVNACQSGGFTALHAAGFNGSMELVTLLLERGADPSIQTDEGQTAADLAREKDHEVIAQLLTPDPPLRKCC